MSKSSTSNNVSTMSTDQTIERKLAPNTECCDSCIEGGPTSSSTTDSSGPAAGAASAAGAGTTVRILTYDSMMPALQAHVDSYRQSHPHTQIVIKSMVSLQQLHLEVLWDLRMQKQRAGTSSFAYDGYIVPPILLGDMYEQGGGLAVWTEEELSESWKDLLPYYKYQVATFGGKVRSLPLLGGSQMLLLFRKDYLDAVGMPTPKTWSDWIRIAAALHDEPLGPGGRPIYGACLGRMSEEACRKRRDERNKQDTVACESQSMTYTQMMLASMTQVGGNSTGWLMDIVDNSESSPTGLKALFQPALERVLALMEQQLKFGAPEELTSDSSLNMRLFRDEGLCGMTVTTEYDPDLLRQENVGFVWLPGSHTFLSRPNQNMVDCTKTLCPYGVDYANWGQVNLVPFGAVTEASVGAVSAYVSASQQDAVKSFFNFVFESDISVGARRQPLTYSELENSDVPGYESIMTAMTSSSNAATPFRIPNAFGLSTELDNRIYDYLLQGIFTDEGRKDLAQSISTSWQWKIRLHDAQGQAEIPTATFYQQSLGTFEPEKAFDLYIGDISRYIGWGVGVLSCFVSLLMALLVWKYRHERVFRASQPLFLWMICGGTFIMASSIFPFGVDDNIATYSGSSIACISAPWLYSLGFVCMFSALFSKIWLINRIFRSPQNQQRIQLKKMDVLSPFLLLFGTNAAALVVWTIIDQPHWVRLPIDGDSPSLNLMEESTYGLCESEHTKIYLGIIIGTNFVMMMISIVQAYECRKITTEYGESLWIGSSVVTIAQVWMIGLPLFWLLNKNPEAVFLTKVGIIFVSSMAPILFIFRPKMPYLQRDLDASMEAQKGASNDQDLVSHSDTKSYLEEDCGNTNGTSNDTSQEVQTKKKPRGVIGIRVIQSSVIHSEEVDVLQMAVEKAERRNHALQGTLEKLQEKMEQYIVARDPLGSSKAATSSRPDAYTRVEDSGGFGGGRALIVGKSSILVARPGQITAPEASVSFRQ